MLIPAAAANELRVNVESLSSADVSVSTFVTFVKSASITVLSFDSETMSVPAPPETVSILEKSSVANVKVSAPAFPVKLSPLSDADPVI